MVSKTTIRFVDVLIAATLIVGAVLSATLVETVIGSAPSISVGPIVSASSGGGVHHLEVPVRVRNSGPLSVDNIGIQLEVFDSANDTIVAGFAGPLNVAPGQQENLNVSLVADFEDVPTSVASGLLTKDQNLTLTASLTTTIPPVLDLVASATGKLPWGAPMKNLGFGPASVSRFNGTFSRVAWSYSFFDNSPYFGFEGQVFGRLIDSSGNVIGRVDPFIASAAPMHPGSGEMTALVMTSALDPGGSTTITGELNVVASGLMGTTVTVGLSA